MSLVPEEGRKRRRTEEIACKWALNLLFSYKMDFFEDK